MIMELVLYTVKEGKKAEFRQLRLKIHQQLARQEGYVAAKTMENFQHSLQHVDMIHWEDREKAMRAHDMFHNLEHHDAFMGTIENVEFSGYFNTIKAEKP